jgi:F0F1-type ATP synthase membrane subunit b/b'
LEEAKKNILDTLRAESERERTRLLRESEESAAKIKADADFVAQQEVKVARYELRKEMALMAQAAAEQIIKADFRDADQQHLLDQFLLGIKESG